MEEAEVAREVTSLVMVHREPFVMSVALRGSPTPALLALAQIAGDIIGASATDEAHLEEGLSIFADLTADQARGRFAQQGTVPPARPN